MARKQKTISENPKPIQGYTQATPTLSASADWSVSGFRLQAVIIAVLGFLFYVNTVGNGSAFDDKLVITGNEYVQAGFSGIPKILTSETYESFSKQQKIGNPLTGGRYRPLSIVTFAVEQQFLGTSEPLQKNAKADAAAYKKLQDKQESDMHLRHAVNMLLYMLLGIVLLYLFRTLFFVRQPMAAFFAALCFMVHPIHTEVVANVKSRDEILSLLFICGTIVYAFRYEVTQKTVDRILALAAFFLALLSKEYAVMLVVLLPATLFVLKGYDLKKLAMATWPFLIPLIIYIALRISSVSAASETAGEEIMNNPYLYATTTEKWATIFLVLQKYVALLVWPAQLTSDYSYNQIPYCTFGDIRVIGSILLYGMLILAGVYLVLKRHLLGIGISIYLLFLLLVSNVFINIGAPVGERLLFHSTLGFAMITGWLMNKLWERPGNSSTRRYTLLACVATLVVLSGFKTITRNRDWASDATLFLQDVKTSPNSIITNCNAGAAMLDRADAATDSATVREYLATGIGYLSKAISVHPRYMLAYINRGIIFLRQKDFERALNDCDTVNKYYPMHPALAYLSYVLSDHYLQAGLQNGRAGNTGDAIANFKKAVRAMPGDADLWYDLGYAYFTTGETDEARKSFARALAIRPAHPQARTMMNNLQKK